MWGETRLSKLLIPMCRGQWWVNLTVLSLSVPVHGATFTQKWNQKSPVQDAPHWHHLRKCYSVKKQPKKAATPPQLPQQTQIRQHLKLAGNSFPKEVVYKWNSKELIGLIWDQELSRTQGARAGREEQHGTQGTGNIPGTGTLLEILLCSHKSVSHLHNIYFSLVFFMMDLEQHFSVSFYCALHRNSRIF